MSTRRRPTEVRALLLEAAERLFGARGYHGTTAEEIAAAAGVARSVLYRHFENKSELFQHAVLQPFTELLREWSYAWQSQLDEPWDDERLMRTAVGLFYDSFESHRDTILAIVTASNELDEEVNNALNTELRRFFAQMALISEREVALRRDWMSREGLDLTTRATMGSIVAMTVLARLFFVPGDRRPPREEIIDHVSRLVLYGMRLEPPEGPQPPPNRDGRPKHQERT
jgi:AcrR family transcriptional regulator